MLIDPFTIIYLLFAFNLVCAIVGLLMISGLLDRSDQMETEIREIEKKQRQDEEPLLRLIAESQEMTAKMIEKEEERGRGND